MNEEDVLGWGYYSTVQTKSVRRLRSQIVKISYHVPCRVDDVYVLAILRRIRSAFQFVSDQQLGPRIVKSNIFERRLEISLHSNLKPITEEFTSSTDLAIKIGDLSSKLQALGKGNGGISVQNVVVNSGIAQLIAPEYLYNLSDIGSDPIVCYYAKMLNLDLFSIQDQYSFQELDFNVFSRELFESRRPAPPKAGQVFVFYVT